MRTLKGRVNAARSTVIAGFAAVAILVGWNGLASAQTPPFPIDTAASDEVAGYVVFPKIVVDTSGLLGDPVDTLVELTNTNFDEPAAVNCTWVDAIGHCGLSSPDQLCPTGDFCLDNSNCPAGQECVPCWTETDFDMQLTSGQPIGFRASTGLVLPCFGIVPPPGCAEDTQKGAVLKTPSDPFVGELKCYQTTTFVSPPDPGIPAGRNDLKGEATIISSTPSNLRTAAYNAVGFQTDDTDGTSSTLPLCLGGPLGAPCGLDDCAKVYAGCSGVLILNHFFDGAPAPFNDEVSVHTVLTLTPCSEAFADGISNQGLTTVQFLIYNEFELRFSASTKVQCYKDIEIADIDTRPGADDDRFSVFSAGVQGTLTGQTRIRGVEGQEDTTGHGLLGIAYEEYRDPTDVVLETTAFNLHMQGTRDQGDAVCR